MGTSFRQVTRLAVAGLVLLAGGVLPAAWAQTAADPVGTPDTPETLEADIGRAAEAWKSRVFLVVADGGPCRRSLGEVLEDPSVLFRQRRVGCALYVGEDRLLLTTASLIRSNPVVEIFDEAGRQVVARIVASDPYLDLALIEAAEELPGTQDLPPLEVVTDPEPGSACLVLGNAYGRSLSASLGSVGAQVVIAPAGLPVHARRINVPIFPGDSGGAVLDREGRFLGIVTAASQSGRPVHLVTGAGEVAIRELQPPLAGVAGFAISAADCEVAWRDLRDHGRVRRGYLGVQMALRREAAGGARILAVTPGSPAANAGIVAGDRVTLFGSWPVTGARQLCALVARCRPADRFDVRFIRGDGEHLVTVEVGEATAPPGIVRVTEPGGAPSASGVEVRPAQLDVPVRPRAPGAR